MGLLEKLINIILGKDDTTNNTYQTYSSYNNNYNGNNNSTDTPLEYFEEILNSEFYQYDLRRDVSTTELGAPEEFRRYDFVLYSNLKPVLAIMVTPHNRDNNRAFLGAKDYCINSGISFLNFYSHFENERTYVINRIKSVL